MITPRQAPHRLVKLPQLGNPVRGMRPINLLSGNRFCKIAALHPS